MVDERYYTKVEPIFEDGEWWYVQPGDGNRRRVTSHARKNTTRMFVNGKYIPKSHPLHKPGNYKSLDDAWSHTEIEKTTDGEVYLVINPAWPDWVKLGKAAIATDRLSGYQTGSPYRDYIILCSVYVDNRHDTEKELLQTFKKHATEYKGEWFKIPHGEAIDLLEEGSHDGGIA
jgi:hypothetical protein